MGRKIRATIELSNVRTWSYISRKMQYFFIIESSIVIKAFHSNPSNWASLDQRRSGAADPSFPTPRTYLALSAPLFTDKLWGLKIFVKTFSKKFGSYYDAKIVL